MPVWAAGAKALSTFIQGEPCPGDFAASPPRHGSAMFTRWTSKSKRSVDLSFLNHEEVNAVLGVLERDKEVRRMNSERLK